MDKASLDDDVWPDSFEGVDHVGIAVNSTAAGRQSLCKERFKERPQLWLRIFRDLILASNDVMISRVHKN